MSIAPWLPCESVFMAWNLSPIAAHEQLVTTVRTIAHAVDAKAGYFPGHSDGVAYLVGMLGRESGMSIQDLSLLTLASFLHDSGKLHMPDSILMKPGRLTDEEFTVMMEHPIWSVNIAANLSGSQPILPWIRHHHERYDGNGYPDGLKGEAIPWPSRLMLVADAAHVLTTTRPYRAAMTRQETFEVLRENAGTQFCPSAVDLLISRAVWSPSEHPLHQAPEKLPGTDYQV